MTTRSLKLLWDIRDADDAIITFVVSRGMDGYLADAMLRAAVERKFDVLGEAAKRLRDESPLVYATCPSLRGAIAFRNFLTHVYDQVDAAKVWETVATDIGPLRAQVAAALAELERS